MLLRKFLGAGAVGVSLVAASLTGSAPAIAQPAPGAASAGWATEGYPCGYSEGGVNSYWNNCSGRGQNIIRDFRIGGNSGRLCVNVGVNIIGSNVIFQNAWVDQSNPWC
ncbi:hypothetical protein [Allokutzneria oryzae]|uniref:Secreted protein n=1 Tax=Allokutzneria oryzae TaxID=1378989 RepID=A0ABV5ZZV0_9PSEU